MSDTTDTMIVSPKEWHRPIAIDDEKILTTTREILHDIMLRKDIAIKEYSLKFDHFAPAIIPLQPFSDYDLSPQLSHHIAVAAQRIRRFAQFQHRNYQTDSFSDQFGEYGQIVQPIETMAAYIPAGRFPLISTAMMTLIPAEVAGCSTRIAVSPSTNAALLAAASLAGATKFIHLGGAQAIAALAYGSELTPAVDMIVGPGNAYVNTAKRLLQDRVRIDTLAGPSELLILSDGTAPAQWLAYDMLAQAEHDPAAIAVLVSRSLTELKAIAAILKADTAGQTQLLNGQLHLIWAESKAETVDFANGMAAEHLLLCDAAIEMSELHHYGSLFLGDYSAIALGDYCSGPNHTLPTNGFARKKSGLQVGDFLRIQTYQKISASTYHTIAETAITLAEAEGLTYHRKSLEVRKQR